MHLETSIRQYLNRNWNLKLETNADMILSRQSFQIRSQNGMFVGKRLWRALRRRWKIQKLEYSSLIGRYHRVCTSSVHFALRPVVEYLILIGDSMK